MLGNFRYLIRLGKPALDRPRVRQNTSILFSLFIYLFYNANTVMQ